MRSGYGMSIPYYFALAPNYDFTFNPLYTVPPGHPVAGRVAAPVWRTASTTSSWPASIRTRATCPPIIVDPRRLRRLPRQHRDARACSRWRAGGTSGGTSRRATDDTFRRFYKLDNILATDVVDRVFLNGISERNYFGLEADHFISQQFTGNGAGRRATSPYAHPMLDYNYVVADPWLGGEFRWNTNALSFSSNQDPTALVPYDGTEQMNRVVTEVDWRKRFIDPIGLTYTPFAQLRGDIYQLSDYVDPQDPNGPPRRAPRLRAAWRWRA